MPAVAKYTSDEILDAASSLIAEKGAAAASVAEIGRRLGAPSGSVYHRFPSRDALLASLWLRTVERFQDGFIACLAGGDAAAARAACHYVVEWVRRHGHEARLLMTYRREDLISGDFPDPVRAAAKRLAGELDEAFDHVAAGLGVPRSAVTFGLVDLPYAAVRRSLTEGRPIDEWTVGYVETALEAVLGLTPTR